jgi:hypothetical protein
VRLALITRDWPARQSSGEVSRALLRALSEFRENGGLLIAHLVRIVSPSTV